MIGISICACRAIAALPIPARRGNPAAQYWLGVCYRNGHGTAANQKKAKYWFKKAAENGDENARKAQ